MPTTVATLPAPGSPDNVYNAEWREHDGLRLLVVASKRPDKGAGFVASSLEAAVPEVAVDAGVWARCKASSPKVWISVNGGRSFQDWIIDRMMFLALMINLPGLNRYKARAIAILESHERGQITFSDRYSSDPVLQQIKLLAETRIDALDAKEIASRAELKSDSSLNQIEDLRDDITFRKDRAFTIAGLGHRGWTFDTPELRKEIGNQCAKIAKEWGDVVPKEPSGRWNENLHKPKTFDIWEKRYGPQYRTTHYSQRRDHYRQS